LARLLILDASTFPEIVPEITGARKLALPAIALWRRHSAHHRRAWPATLHCALWALTLLGSRRLDRHVRRGAHYPPTAIGIALAPERLKQQKKLLGQHLRRLNKKLNCPLVWADRLKIQSIKRER